MSQFHVDNSQDYEYLQRKLLSQGPDYLFFCSRVGGEESFPLVLNCIFRVARRDQAPLSQDTPNLFLLLSPCHAFLVYFLSVIASPATTPDKNSGRFYIHIFKELISGS